MIMAPSQPKPTQTSRALKLIDDKKCRESIFKKRKDTLKKKATELATLCDVPVCMVCFYHEGEVETWPENKAEVEAIINKYHHRLGEKERGKKTKVDNPILPAKNPNLEESMKENFDNAIVSSEDQLLNGLLEEGLWGLLNFLDYKLQAMDERIKVLRMEADEGKETDDEYYAEEVKPEPPSDLFDIIRTCNSDHMARQEIDPQPVPDFLAKN